MHGSRVASTLSRRHFILTAATAAGGLMIGIGAAPAPRPRRDGRGAALERRQRLLRRTKSTPGSPSIRTIPS